ncbi:MAG: VOC family protein [Acaryochloridaceae cyanobacterium RU_4_10]|nr:VOC family protein [Acaryochloridaceae cyanobacterium RU_4_10]
MNNPYQQHGAFSWCELMTTDLKGAEAFYSKLFGWTMADGPVEGMEYRVVSAGGQGIGGLMTLPPDKQNIPPHWGSYVTVDDADATAKLAEELGGKILISPHDIPTVGRFTLLQDPQGAVISAISYASAA